MSQEQRTLLAVLLMFGLVVLYQALFAPKTPPPKPPATAAPGTTPPGGTQTPAPGPAKPTTAPVAPPAGSGEAAEREVRVETPALTVVLSTKGGGGKTWRLKNYVVAGKGPVDIIAPVPPGVSPPLAAWGYEGLPAPVPEEVNRTALRLERSDEDGTVVFSRKDPNGLLTEKRLRFRGGYTVEVELRLRNEGRAGLPVEPKIVWGPGFYESRDKAKESAQRDPTTWVNGSRVTDSPKSLKPGTFTVHEGVVDWTALQDQYFAAALIPETKGSAAFVAVAEDGQPWVGLRWPAATLRPGESTALRLRTYGGPKELGELAAAGPHLDRLVDLRFTSWNLGALNEAFEFGLARPALYLLRFLRSITGNYGLAIILLTIIVKAALFPLTQKSLKSMKAMQDLQPRIQAIRDKYKRGRPGDRQKMNEEIAELFRRHKVSGLAGCLPMLVQMPVLIALYYALSNSIDLWQAHFLWIKDLSSPEQGLFALPEGIPFLGGLEFRGLPLVMGATQFLQMKMSPTGADPAQAAMMTYVMPVFLTFIFYSFPSGLVLYWLCFNVLQIGQQYLLNKSLARAKGEE